MQFAYTFDLNEEDEISPDKIVDLIKFSDKLAEIFEKIEKLLAKRGVKRKYHEAFG